MGKLCFNIFKDKVNVKKNIFSTILLTDALTKNFLGTTEEVEKTSSLAIMKKERPKNYNPYTTTLEMQRRNYYAKILVQKIREYINAKHKSQQKRRSLQKATFDDEETII